MLKIFIVSIVVLFQVAAAFATEKPYTILSGQEARAVFDQCKRMTPMFRTSYRDLDEQKVKDIEAKLIDQLDKAANSKNETVVNFADYQRQYVAYEMLRRELIYINGFHKGAEKSVLEAKSRKQIPANDWQTQAINHCGGGNQYWGVIYDPDSMAVLELLFNASSTGQ